MSVNEIRELEKPTSYQHIDNLKRGPKIVEEVKVEPKVEIKIPQEYHHIANDINPLVKSNNDNSSSMLIIFVAIVGIFLVGSTIGEKNHSKKNKKEEKSEIKIPENKE